ncbi:hypothetical protein M3Y97_00230600 [Aphelenchoides bicaudatus]|nr:hypothetical protein M3Y97_00230600 [Aphelenchoides bicaudatus]
MFRILEMADLPPISANSALPPTNDNRMQKKGKKLSKLGMGALPTDVFIRSLRTYSPNGEKTVEETPQKTCSRGHQPTTLMTSSRSSSSCSRTPNSRSTISSIT